MTHAGRFATTRWSVVLAAGGADGVSGRNSSAARDALGTLCATYWYPLYAYARRRGSTPADAQDLVQGFFAELLQGGGVAAADEERGRFRGFLVTAFRHHVSRMKEHAGAKKRGGDRLFLRLDFERGESRYSHEPADEVTPERIYERRFALTVLDTALSRLRHEMAQLARADAFDTLRVYLDGGSPLPAYRDVAAQLGMTVGAVKVTVHRMRRRYRDVLRATIGETLGEAEDVDAAVDEEIAHLLASLRA